jgi:hypothetical protein
MSEAGEGVELLAEEWNVNELASTMWWTFYLNDLHFGKKACNSTKDTIQNYFRSILDWFLHTGSTTTPLGHESRLDWFSELSNHRKQGSINNRICLTAVQPLNIVENANRESNK